jgi:hypothetical protein
LTRAAVPAISPPKKLTVPPLPYRFLGKITQESGVQVFLADDARLFAVREGDVLDATYRVDSVAGDRVTLTYLPLGRKQAIVLDASPSVSQEKESSGAQVVWDGPRQTKQGASFSLALRLKSREAIGASPMQVRFDPTLLESVAVQPGDFYAERAGFGYSVDADGHIEISASSKDPAPAADATLVVLTFRPIRPAPSAQVSLASLRLQDRYGQPVSTQSATFTTAILP